MAMSFLCNLGPVWYHPTILSLAAKQVGWLITSITSEKHIQCKTQLNYTDLCLTINFLEHAIHVLQVVMIQEPH